MTEVQKKGMSKGCMVGLIIGIVLVVVIAGALVTCYMFRDDLFKMGVTTVVGSTKTVLAEKPVEGVDTVQFNALVDAFNEKLTAEDSLDLEKYGAFMQRVQMAVGDEEFDASDVELLTGEMIDFYPELESLWQLPEAVDPDAVVEDSTAVEE